MKAAAFIRYLALAVLVLATQAFSQSAKTINPNDCSTRVLCAYAIQLQHLLDAAKTDASFRTPDGIPDTVQSVMAVWTTPDSFVAALAADAAFDNTLSAWEQSRIDKQTGSTATSSGTTDLVSRPSTSELLSLAVQVGALTQTISGNTATLQGNADGVYKALFKAPVVCFNCTGTPILKNINFSASFDLSQQTSKTVTTSGPANPSTPPVGTIQLPQSSRQLSSFTARYDIYNPLDPRSKQFKTTWVTAYKNHQADFLTAAKALLNSMQTVLAKLPANEQYKSLQTQYLPRIKQAATDQNATALAQIFEEFFNEVVKIARAQDPDFDKNISLAVVALAQYSQLNYQAVQEARGKPQFTFEYTYNRPPNQPDTHAFRLIIGLNPAHGAGLFSLNAAGTVYGGTIPTGAAYGRIRDFQISGQFDRILGDDINHKATLSLAGYVQYQFDPSVLNISSGNLAPGTNIVLPGNAQVLLGTKGTLGIVQGKVTFNLKSGLNIPVGISWANKTDLLNATDVRGNVGITYDFDSITQLLTGRQQ